MKKLERHEMKNLKGGLYDEGGGCSMTYQNSGGQWVTESGGCDVSCIGLWEQVCTPFCHTSTFTSPTPVSSNGGVSRCGQPFVRYD